MSLKTKNVFLTGGAAGLGRAFIEKLLAAGARVVFGDLNAEAGKATEKEFAAKYGANNVLFIQFDVSDSKKFEEAFETAVKKLGFVDLMVNNAGLMFEAKWEKMIQVNYAALVKGTYIAMEHMRNDKGGRGGRIINVSSEQSLFTSFTLPVYCSTKHASRAFTTCLAEAPVRHGIDFGILCPGATETGLTKNIGPGTVVHAEFVPDAVRAPGFLGPIEPVANGFMTLATMENLNGAMMYVHKDEVTYYKMEKVPISWPPKDAQKS